MLSVFKAGTHLVRQILQDLTGLPFFEPAIIPGRVDYRDPAQLQFVPGHFYSWHLVPTPPIRQALRAAQARPVLVMRNLFDLTVSMYHHFADNIDADIGRGRNVQHHFAALGKDAGLEAIITGMTRPDFRWAGLGPQADHMVQMFELAASMPCHLTSFERVTENKPAEVTALAEFLGLPLSDERRAQIVAGSAFEAMRGRAREAGRGSHFRRGQARSHASELTPRHVALIREVVAREAPALAGWAERTGFHELLASDG